MSEAGPATRTRAASRTSRESTPTATNPSRRTGRAAREDTPATVRRGAGRLANRRNLAPHDGDDALPSVSNKDSKAYGASGKLTGPVQMDVDQAFTRPDLAINTAIAQSSARDAGHLPTVAEATAETQIQSNDNANTNFQGAPQHAVETQRASPDEEEHEDQTVRAFNISAWAIRVAEEGTLFGRLKRFLINVWTKISAYSLVVQDYLAESWISRRFFENVFTLLLLAVLFFVIDLLYGPLHPVLDSPQMRAMRPSTGYNLTAPKDGTSRQFVLFENRVSDLELKYLNIASTKATSAIHPQINWFEIGQGAVIDPHLSSPSFVAKDDLTFTAYFTALFTLRKHARAPAPFSRAPAEALTHWNDGGLDRWCAPSSRGKLQLTVHTARPIAPNELIVEHIAKGATIFVGMAPREIELWADIQDPDAFTNLQRAILTHDRSLLLESSPQSDKELAPSQALPITFLPIGRFHYDVNNNQAVQNFIVPIDLAAMGIKSSRFAFRANSNWGSYDATCINRLRLHGVDMSGEIEDLEEAL